MKDGFAHFSDYPCCNWKLQASHCAKQVFWTLLLLHVSLPTAVAQSRLEFTTFESASLVGNPAGDPSTRRAQVYLPPSYEQSQRSYPVLYLLHGTGGNEESFRGLHDVADTAIGIGRSEEFIVVAVDGSSRYSASFYENSVLNGNHRDYIAEDLVAHIDANYRTIADRDSRGVAGHSTGGYGAILFAMKEADVFGAAYSMSGGGLCFTRPECATYLGGDVAVFNEGFRTWGPGLGPFANEGEALAAVQEPGDVSNLLQREMYSMASAYSPNLANQPLLVDLPWETPSLEIVPEVRDRWFEHDVFEMLPQYVDELKSLRGFAFDVGEQDEFGLAGEATSFHEALVEADVPHDFTVYQGRHTNRINERLGEVLAFFSDRLVIPELAVCDFDENGSCDAADLSSDFLFSVDLTVGSTRSIDVQNYDLTRDFVVDRADLDAWLALAAETQGFSEPFAVGDTNLDGDVNFVDFLALFDGLNGDARDWANGNFTGGSDVGFEDFLALSANFGTTLERQSIESVPEPSCNWLLVFLAAAISRRAFAPVVNC